MFEDLIKKKAAKEIEEEPALFQCPFAIEFHDQCGDYDEAILQGLTSCRYYGLLTGYCYNKGHSHEILT